MKACKGCPFRRDTPAGQLGGSATQVYIGQAAGPFWLPCHNSSGYSRDTRLDPTHRQCAGAAIYRANCGYDKRMPPGLLSLPADNTDVFGTPAEFVAHHEHMSVEASKEVLEIVTPEILCSYEMAKKDVQRVKPAKSV